MKDHGARFQKTEQKAQVVLFWSMPLEKLRLEQRENLDMDGMWHDEIWHGRSVV